MIFFPEEITSNFKRGVKSSVTRDPEYLKSHEEFQAQVDFHVSLLVGDFKDKVEKLYPSRYSPRLLPPKQRSEKDILKEEIDKMLTILNYFFSNKVIKEEPSLLLSLMFIPDPTTIRILEGSEEFHITKKEIQALRNFYNTHIKNKHELDYDSIIPNPHEVEKDAQDVTCKVNCLAMATFYHWLKEQHKLLRRRRNKSQTPETIIEIWKPDNTGSKKEYDRMIEKLKMNNLKIDDAFISEENGKLYWNRKIYGSVNYLAAWLHLCIKRNWVDDTLSAPQYKKILNNTFNAGIGSTTPFKRIDIKPPNDEYCAPFNNIPNNIPLKD